MPISSGDILKVCEILAKEEQLQVTTNEAFKGACCTFAGAFVGGVLGGPVGLGIGSAAAGAFVAYKSRGKFKSAVYVIMYEMSERDRQNLVDSVMSALNKIDSSDVMTLITILNTDRMLRATIIELIKNSLTQNMGLKLL